MLHAASYSGIAIVPNASDVQYDIALRSASVRIGRSTSKSVQMCAIASGCQAVLQATSPSDGFVVAEEMGRLLWRGPG